MEPSSVATRNIEVDLGQEIVEARVTLSVSRLNDVLRLLIDKTNAQGSELSSVQEELAALKERTGINEKALDDIKPDGQRQQKLESTMDSFASQLEKIRRDYDYRLEQSSKAYKQRHEQFDLVIESLQDDVLKQTAFLRDACAKNAALGAEHTARLDAIVIPDIKPLEADVDSIQTWRGEAHDRIKQCQRFVHLFAPNHDEVLRVCGPKVRGIDEEAETPEAIFAEKVLTDTEREAILAEKVKYARSLPPLASLFEELREGDKAIARESEDRDTQLKDKLAEKINKHEIAELANTLKEQHSQVRQSVEFLDRRLRETDDLAHRVSSTEEKVKYLHYHKAEASSLEFKADNSVVQDLRGEMLEVRDDLTDIFQKLSQVAHSPTAAGSSVNSQLGHHSGSFVGGMSGPAARRVSSAGSVADGDGSSSGPNRGLIRRVGELADLITSLEKRKADRADVIRLHEYLEGLQKSGKLAVGDSGDSIGDLTATMRQQDHHANSSSSSAAATGGGSRGAAYSPRGGGAGGVAGPGEAGGELGRSVSPGGTPRRDGGGGSTLHARPPARDRPNSSGASGAGAGGGGAAGHTQSGSAQSPSSAPTRSQYQYQSQGAGYSPSHSATGNTLATKRIGSASAARRDEGQGNPADGTMLFGGSTNSGMDSLASPLIGSLTATVSAGEPVRQALGRSVCGVRDSGGASVPVTIGTHHGEPNVKYSDY